MKQLIKKIILFSSLHFASAIISISKCCPLGEALDQLGACRKVQVDHFVEEVNHWTLDSYSQFEIAFLSSVVWCQHKYV